MSNAVMIVTVLALTGFVLSAAAVAAWAFWKLSAEQRARASAAADLEAERRQVAQLREAEAALLRELRQERDKREAAVERERELSSRIASLRSTLDAERDAEQKRRAELESRLEKAEKTFREAIDHSAKRALEGANKQLLQLAGEHFDKRHEAVSKLVEPIQQTLKKTDEKLHALERARTEAYTRLHEQVDHLRQSDAALRTETTKLVAALRKPQVRGRYGEIQLQRVAELAGMTSYCDFATQTSVRDSEGNLLRPDMIVSLPNGRQIIVDAKTNIEAYVDALDCEDPDEQSTHLDRFASHVLDQAKKLSSKKYFAEYEGSAEFTVMFIPGDQFIDAALERRPDLLDIAASHNVLLASPSTLIGMLRAVAVGWREKELTERAAELFELGRELHERTAVLIGHADKLGTHLDRAVRSFNDLTGSMDRRLMPTLRKFEEAGAKSGKELREVKPVEGQAALPTKLENAAAPDANDATA